MAAILNLGKLVNVNSTIIPVAMASRVQGTASTNRFQIINSTYALIQINLSTRDYGVSIPVMPSEVQVIVDINNLQESTRDYGTDITPGPAVRVLDGTDTTRIRISPMFWA